MLVRLFELRRRLAIFSQICFHCHMWTGCWIALCIDKFGSSKCVLVVSRWVWAMWSRHFRTSSLFHSESRKLHHLLGNAEYGYLIECQPWFVSHLEAYYSLNYSCVMSWVHPPLDASSQSYGWFQNQVALTEASRARVYRSYQRSLLSFKMFGGPCITWTPQLLNMSVIEEYPSLLRDIRQVWYSGCLSALWGSFVKSRSIAVFPRLSGYRKEPISFVRVVHLYLSLNIHSALSRRVPWWYKLCFQGM